MHDPLPPDTQATPNCERVRQALESWLYGRKFTGNEAELHLQIRYLLLEHGEAVMLMRNISNSPLMSNLEKVRDFLKRHTA
jgi:hypothetical protein